MSDPDYFLQDMQDGAGLDLLTSEMDLIPGATAIRKYELRLVLQDLPPERTVWIEGGALGRSRGEETTVGDLIDELEP